jgi:hypothetical protein
LKRRDFITLLGGAGGSHPVFLSASPLISGFSCKIMFNKEV